MSGHLSFVSYEAGWILGYSFYVSAVLSSCLTPPVSVCSPLSCCIQLLKVCPYPSVGKGMATSLRRA